MHCHLKRGLINNFVTGLTPFLYKRASMPRLVLHSGKRRIIIILPFLKMRQPHMGRRRSAAQPSLAARHVGFWSA